MIIGANEDVLALTCDVAQQAAALRIDNTFSGVTRYPMDRSLESSIAGGLIKADVSH